MNLAPNGKPSNLTPEQYKLVRTPAFKAWFGDWENSPEVASKVVDENGEPKVVFHGSERSDSILISGIFKAYGSELNELYFTDNTNTALSYTYDEFFDDEEEWIDTEENIDNVIAVFLNIKNPKIKDFKGRTFTDFWNIKKDNDGNILTNVYDVRVINENLKRKDYLGNTYIVYKSEQIKLADGTNITFDSNNPDIRYNNGGLTMKKPKAKLLAPNGKPSNLTPEFNRGTTDYVANDYLKKKYNYLKKENATFEDLPEIYVRIGLPRKRKDNYLPSINHLTKEKEVGISVFTARYSPNSGFVFIDLEDGYGYQDYNYDLRGTYSGFQGEEIYLVEGDVVKGRKQFVKLYSGAMKDISLPYERGSDGERLLHTENFKIIGKLNKNKIVASEDYYKDYLYLNNAVTFDGKELKKYPKYTDGGLIAPNGKPSNLTPEQYLLVRTPAFKAWFGDWENSPETASRVVDENGEPKIKWRGDNNPKNVFDYTNYGGYGVYYFGDKGFAESFGNKLNSYFINSKNPFYPNKLSEKQEKEIRNLLKKDANQILTEQIKNNGFNDLYDFLDNYYLIEAGFDESSNSLDILLYQLKNGLNYFILDLRPIIEWLKSNNYDGYESYEGNYDNIAVFNPNQIKLADGTNTTFDANNPDIRYKNGGHLESSLDIKNVLKYLNPTSEEKEISIRRQWDDLINRFSSLIPYFFEQENIDYNCEDYESTQIKLADGTNTTFDSNNPDIRYAEGGEINQTEELIKSFLKKQELIDDEPKRSYNDMRIGDTINVTNEYVDLPESQATPDKGIYKLMVIPISKTDHFIRGAVNREAFAYDDYDGWQTENLNNIKKTFDSDRRQPIIVSEGKDGLFTVIDGHHRLTVANELGRKSILALVREFKNNPIPSHYAESVYGTENVYGISKRYHKIKLELPNIPNPDIKNINFVNKIDEILNSENKYELGGELTLTSEQVEKKLGRKLHWWNDDVVTINGTEYKKVFLKPEYKIK